MGIGDGGGAGEEAERRFLMRMIAMASGFDREREWERETIELFFFGEGGFRVSRLDQMHGAKVVEML